MLGSCRFPSREDCRARDNGILRVGSHVQLCDSVGCDGFDTSNREMEEPPAGMILDEGFWIQELLPRDSQMRHATVGLWPQDAAVSWRGLVGIG